MTSAPPGGASCPASQRPDAAPSSWPRTAVSSGLQHPQPPRAAEEESICLSINKLMNKKYFITNNFFFFRENLILLPQTSKRHQFIKENFKRDRYTL